MRAEDIWVCAISYDEVEVLAGFARRFGIEYPLLADTDSEVIRRFGILNELIPADHSWYGVPFPGTFISDDQGRVVEKSFYANHGVRDSVPRLVREGLGVDGGVGPFQRVEAGPVTATGSLSAATFRPGQVQTFAVQLEVAAGYHVQARDLPEGYIEIDLGFSAVEGVEFGPVAYPPSEPLRLESLGETLNIYGNKVHLKVPVTCRRKEGFALKARLRFQACDSAQCYLPEAVDFEFLVDVVDNIWG